MTEEGSASAGRYGFRAGMSAAQRESVHKRGGLRGKDPRDVVYDGYNTRYRIPLTGDIADRKRTRRWQGAIDSESTTEQP
jgi:hypothetical protein